MCGFGWFSTRRRACFAVGRLERRLQIKKIIPVYPHPLRIGAVARMSRSVTMIRRAVAAD